MPSFKPKAVKKIKQYNKYSATLDCKHNEYINIFAKDENVNIPKLYNELNQLKLQMLNKKMDIEHKMDIKEKIKYH